MSNENIQPLSPLVQFDLSEIQVPQGLLKVRELAFHGHVNLRGSLTDTAFVEAVESVIGTAFEIENNCFIETKDLNVLWYGPNEWLIITSPDKQTDLVARLKTALGETFSAVTDISGGNTIVEISGSKVRELLSCGSMVDFHPCEFVKGHCVQTLFAKTNVAIYQIDQADVFRMVVRRSFSDYMGAWISDTITSLALVE